ncbi:BON domain-containing protein [Brevifollis gellanilyticus]|uniref:BON domain-containing protein n=1 Tax=Brevifollis gellanilyticus TaxID=748831 RepID=UPI0011BFB6EA|nr:BON domain-containing protein [Brevifollis gellanilyticus]
MKLTSFTRPILVALAAFTFSATAADQNSTPPDNTEKNERDRSGDNKTPIDQSNRPEDIKLVAEIRKAVVADDSLSMTAKNVKIITTPGKVTLRGPVNTADEKTKIAAHAKAKAGQSEIVDQIEVKAADSTK